MKKIIIILISLLFPLNVLAYSDYIIPGGNNIGIEVYNEGIIVIGFYKINNKYNDNDLRIGDIIIKVENDNVYTVEDMVSSIEKNVKDNKVNITILRKNEEKEIDFNLINQSGVYKTGLYVKDSISGIGTLTYIDPETKIYGALGHEIIEGTSLTTVEVRSGTIFESLVTSIDRSSAGTAGTKNAKFYSNNVYGNVNKNTISGIYGEYKRDLPEVETLEVGKPEDLKEGKAIIRTVLNKDKINEYEIEITNINKNSDIKNISFKIIDKELIEKTGGIIQGMSGSPIIQNNKLIGAVTHVFLNDPTKAFGVYIDWMINN